MELIRNNIVRHSCIMIKKTYKNYFMLSVTVLLSFTIMLGYLVYTDSNIYNKYNEILGANPNVILSHNAYSYEEQQNINKLMAQLDKLSNTYYYISGQTNVSTSFGRRCEVIFYPNYVWGMFKICLFDGYATGLERLKVNGDWQFSLGSDEAIVSQQVYDSLKEYSDGKPTINLIFKDKNGNERLKKYNVAGTYTSDVFEYKDMDTSIDIDPVFVPFSSIDEYNNYISNIEVVIHTDKVDFVTEQLVKNNLACLNIKSEQNNALIEKRAIVQNKYIIAMVLFILLGINMYSSFMNALNERKFEIGVKRALGAGKFSIMLQFIIEGFAVMLFNIILSVVLVVNMAITYKYVMIEFFETNYTITLSNESVILFLIFGFFLTLIFSMVFAYKSTKVEIIKYLKEE